MRGRDRRRSRRCSRPSPPRCPAAEDRPGQRAMAEAIDAGAARRHARHRAGRHRHRQDDGLPRARDRRCRDAETRSSSPRRRRRCRTSSRRRTSRSSPSTCRSPFDVGGAEGAQQLRLPAAPARAARRPGPGRARARRARRARSRVDVKRLVDVGGHDARPATSAELDWSPSDQAQRAVTRQQRRVPRRDALPDGSSRASPSGRDARRRPPTSSSSTSTCTGSTSPAAASSCPSTTSSSIDEAHRLEDIMSDTVGVQIGAGRFAALAAALRRVIDDPTIVARRVRRRLGGARAARAARRHAGCPIAAPGRPAGRCSSRRADAGRRPRRTRCARSRPTSAPASTTPSSACCARSRWRRGCRTTSTSRSASTTATSRSSPAAPSTRGSRSPRSTSARSSQAGIWSQRTAILTSATIPTSLAAHGRPRRRTRSTQLDVGSPFDYAHHALLYCARAPPRPALAGTRRRGARRDRRADRRRRRAHAGAVHELEGDGRRRGRGARARRRARSSPSATCPKTALIEAFAGDESTCLFATAGFFQGVDIPGRTLSLVVIDRIPFPRPDDPLLSARRELLGAAAFAEIDLPRAAILLAQAAGRLIRIDDRPGRRRRARPAARAPPRYRWGIVEALPPMRRTRHRAEAEAFLREITHAEQDPPRLLTRVRRRGGRRAGAGPRRGRRAASRRSRSTRRRTATRCRSASSATSTRRSTSPRRPTPRVIVLTHTSNTFCAGADLKERGTGAVDSIADGRRAASG